MRHRAHTVTRPLVTAAVALALLAAGCGSDPAEPMPFTPVDTLTAEPTPLTEYEFPDPEPAMAEPEPHQEPEPEFPAPEPAAAEPEPQEEPEPAALEPAAAEPEFPAPEPAAAEPEPQEEPEPAALEPAAAEFAPQRESEPESEDPAESDAEAAVQPDPRTEPEDMAEHGPQLVPCPEGQHRHGDEPCHYDDPEPEPVQAEPQPETAVIEIEDEPSSDEVHPHTTDTVPDPLPASGVFPSARGEQPTVTWQVHVSGIIEGSRPLPTFTAVVQEWSDWCFFDWATRHPDTPAARQQCAIQLSLIGMATELLDISDQCAARQYRGQLEMLTGEGEFDFTTDFGRVGWHACASAIDPEPADDIPSPYFDAELYEASLMPDDECMRASWAAEVYLNQQGIWMAEWRC